MKKLLTLLSALILTSCSFSGEVTTGNNQNIKTDKGTSDQKLKDVSVSRIQITSGETLVIKEGDKMSLSASVIYEDNTRDSSVSWSSSDNTIASVNNTTGSLSGVKEGITTLVATSLKYSSKKANLIVTVKRADVVEAITRIDPKEATLKVGDTVRLNATIQMSDGSLSPNVSWKSDNSSVVLVSNGLVTAIGEGTTTVTAIADGDSTKKAMAKITVSNTTTAPTPTTPIQTTPTASPSAVAQK